MKNIYYKKLFDPVFMTAKKGLIIFSAWIIISIYDLL